jgi:uncharacterized protein (TIGR03067 family)
LLVLSASASCGCQEQKQPALTHQDRIQGRWALVSGERHGEKFAPEAISGVRLVFAGNVLRTEKPGEVTEATFTLHPETSPKGIDIDMDGSLGLGIYRLEGDRLAILHGEVGDPRPADFDAVKGGALTLLNLRRAEN